MNNYTQEYTILENNINKSREKIDSANNGLILLRKELYEIADKISDKKSEYNHLIYKRNRIVSGKDKLISIPMALLTILVEAALVYVGYNIVMIPQETLSKIIVGILTVSLGGCTCIAIALGSKYIRVLMENKLHKKIVKNSIKYQKISEEIEKKKNNIVRLKREKNKIEKNINMILSEITEEKQLIRINAQKLHSLQNEMIDIVLEEQQSRLESSKAYARVRTKHNR